MAKQEFFSLDLTALMNNTEPLLRVPTFLVNGKEASYIPQFISLGPYHYHSSRLQDARVEGLDKVRRISSKEVYKVNFVVERSPNKIGPNASEEWKEMVETINRMEKELESFYNLPISKCQNLGELMLLDSLFLVCFLESTDDGDDLHVRIKCDILKLENQIPLSVLRVVLEKFPLGKTNPPNCENDVKILSWKAYEELSPFTFPAAQSIDIGTALHSQRHLLGCIHAIVSPFLEIRNDCQSRGATITHRISSFLACVVEKMCGIFVCFKRGKLPIKPYSAEKLARAGIKFKSLSKMSEKIHFDEYSYTLYLPQMTVTSLQTEGFFRNLVALELNDRSIGHHVQRNDATFASIGDNMDTLPLSRRHVTRFIQLTNCLIDTPEDVHVLRKAQVISPKTNLDDDNIARIWKSMRQPFFHSHVQLPGVIKGAIKNVLEKNYYKTKIRIGFSEFLQYYDRKYFQHPWSVIALLAGIFLLLMTIIQTYCSVSGRSSVNQLYANL